MTKEEGIDEEDSTKNVTHIFTYYKNGSVKTDSANGVTTTYTYDENNRLMTEAEADGLGATYTDYLYDQNGNQLTTTMKVVKTTLEAKPETAYLLGSLTSSDETKNEYNTFNQLIKAIKKDKVAEYEYNTQGLRTEKTVNGTITKHIWSGANIVLDIQSASKVRYI